MNLQKLIAEIVEKRVATELERALGDLTNTDSNGRPIDDPDFGTRKRAYQTRDGEPEKLAQAPWPSADGSARRGRKRGRGRGTVGYVVKAYRGRGRRPMPSLVPTWQRAWEAIKSARGPVTAREIEKVTGDKQKTVESSIYQLRSLGLVQSVKLPRETAQ